MSAGPISRVVARAFGAAVGLRNQLYEGGRLATHRLPVPVVSVGNLAVGGTGKTPVTEEIARLLSREGWFVGILSRGHGGTRTEEPLIVSDHRRIRRGASEAGDEPYLLARRLPGVPVVVGRDRHRAGLHALAHLPVNLFVLDDGFQHRRLARDVDVVLLDATDPWSGGLMPRGRLREPPSSLARAHAVILTRVEAAGAEAVRDAAADIARLAPEAGIFEAETHPAGVRTLGVRGVEPVESLEDRRVFAFCGIARPGSFFRDVERAGARLTGRKAFPDHHFYRHHDVMRLQREAEERGARLLVTTEKDAVRLPLPTRPDPPIATLRRAYVLHDETRLLHVIGRRLPGPTRGGKALT